VTIKPLSAPGVEHPRLLGHAGMHAPSICPHCWNVNPGPFRLCARCGASMETFLQESGGLRRTPAVQSPVPVARRLSIPQRVVLGLFVLLLALAYAAPLLPVAAGSLFPQTRRAETPP
jgi:hypothetical protein